MGEDAFHITNSPWRKWQKMYSTQQTAHGENGRRCIPHNKEPMEKMAEDVFLTKKPMEKMGEDAFHITKSPWRKWEKMYST